VLLGAVVLVIAVLALRNPKSHVTSAPPDASSTSSSTASPASKTTTSAKQSRSATAAPTSSASKSTAAAAHGAKSIPLVVLNNTETSGLAREAAQTFENGGWTVSSTGNLSNNIVSTCAYYDPNVTGAQAAAEALRQQFPTIQRVKARFAELPTGPIVVVLTPGYSTG
jgi:cytoskeletal protein RodZ